MKLSLLLVAVCKDLTWFFFDSDNQLSQYALSFLICDGLSLPTSRACASIILSIKNLPKFLCLAIGHHGRGKTMQQVPTPYGGGVHEHLECWKIFESERSYCMLGRQKIAQAEKLGQK